MINQELFNIAEKTVDTLKKYNLTISTAESCTGGMVSSYITSVSGVSEIFEMGITTYSCRIKNQALSVKKETLEKFGAVSEQTAREMAENIRIKANSSIGASVTGAAGPDGTEGHPAGYVFIAISNKEKTIVKLLNIEAKSRNFVREKATESLFNLIVDFVEENYNEPL